MRYKQKRRVYRCLRCHLEVNVRPEGKTYRWQDNRQFMHDKCRLHGHEWRRA